MNINPQMEAVIDTRARLPADKTRAKMPAVNMAAPHRVSVRFIIVALRLLETSPTH
jgi:hypothetical protein